MTFHSWFMLFSRSWVTVSHIDVVIRAPRYLNRNSGEMLAMVNEIPSIIPGLKRGLALPQSYSHTFLKVWNPEFFSPAHDQNSLHGATRTI